MPNEGPIRRIPPAKREEVLRLLNEARLPKRQIARLVGVSPTTVIRLSREVINPSKRDAVDRAFADPEKREALIREIGEACLKSCMRRISEARLDPRAIFAFNAIAVEGADPLKGLEVFDRVFGATAAPEPPPISGALA